LKSLEDHVANLSNHGEGDGEVGGDGIETKQDQPVAAVGRERGESLEASNNEAAIFSDILEDPDMQDLEPTSPLIGFETVECEDSFVSNDPSPSAERNSHGPETCGMGNHSAVKADSDLSDQHQMAVVDNREPPSSTTSGVDDPSFLPLPDLRQQVLDELNRRGIRRTTAVAEANLSMSVTFPCTPFSHGSSSPPHH
jgi:hypothetical protein